MLAIVVTLAVGACGDRGLRSAYSSQRYGKVRIESIVRQKCLFLLTWQGRNCIICSTELEGYCIEDRIATR